MQIEIPDFSLIVLIGASSSGKSTFAARHFRPTEIVSSDRCRAMISDDENDQTVTSQAFELVRSIAGKRLEVRRLTVIDATSVQAKDRAFLTRLSKHYHAPLTAIVLDLPEEACLSRSRLRRDRSIPEDVVSKQVRQVRETLTSLEKEKLHAVHVLQSEAAVAGVTVARTPLACDRRSELGPFDIIGDIHGCRLELEMLLDNLGYTAAPNTGIRTHPDGRRAIFVGDLVDRGPDSPGVLRLAMDMVAAGSALAVPGNHDMKLVRKLDGRDVKLAHGLAETVAQMAGLPDEIRKSFSDRTKRFLECLPSHLWLDDGRLVVAHAGMIGDMQGRDSRVVRNFALYGDTSGELDDCGSPVRRNWVAAYSASASVVYGHTPTESPTWINNAICIDTGCVFGGRLTALRYPERNLVEVPARQVYWVPAHLREPMRNCHP